MIDPDPYSPFFPVSALEREIRERLATTDFLAPFGWPDSVDRNLEVLRSETVLYPPEVLRFGTLHYPPDELKTSKAASWLEELSNFIDVFEAALQSEAKEEGKRPATPQWNSDSLTLLYGNTVCRKYRRRNAQNQHAVLDAFEAANWSRSVNSPFGLSERTLRETIDALNRDLEKDSPIRFAVESRKPCGGSA